MVVEGRRSLARTNQDNVNASRESNSTMPQLPQASVLSQVQLPMSNAEVLTKIQLHRMVSAAAPQGRFCGDQVDFVTGDLAHEA